MLVKDFRGTSFLGGRGWGWTCSWDLLMRFPAIHSVLTCLSRGGGLQVRRKILDGSPCTGGLKSYYFKAMTQCCFRLEMKWYVIDTFINCTQLQLEAAWTAATHLFLNNVNARRRDEMWFWWQLTISRTACLQSCKGRNTTNWGNHLRIGGCE